MANSVERYYQKKKRRKKRARMFFFGLAFVLMLLTLAILSVTVFFNAETIVVEGNTHYTAEQILETGGLKIGQNLFRLDKFEVIDRMETLPYVKSVTIKRRLPNTLTVKITENQPVVWLDTATGAALLNEEYRVLELLELPEELVPLSEAEKEAAAAEEAAAEEAAEPGAETTADAAEETPAITENPATEETTETEDSAEAESTPESSPLDGVPQLVFPGEPIKLEVGSAVEFEEDYTGFLQRLYENVCQNTDMEWNLVQEVRFNARYDVELLYNERITIELGTLDQLDTKLKLAVYLMEDNGMAQKATLVVSDVERVYYRPE